MANKHNTVKSISDAFDAVSKDVLALANTNDAERLIFLEMLAKYKAAATKPFVDTPDQEGYQRRRALRFAMGLDEGSMSRRDSSGLERVLSLQVSETSLS